MKHFLHTKSTALYCSAALVMIGLTVSGANAAPTVSGTKGCIVNYNQTTSSHSERSGGGSSDGSGGGGDYSYNNAATCRESNQWPSGRGQPGQPAFTVGNFVSADEVNNVINQVVNIIDQKTDNSTVINQITGDITNQGDRITQVEGDVTNIKGDITNIKGDITNINTKLDDHETRITKNEGDITNINNKLDNHETRITNLEGDVSELQDSAVKYDKDANGNKTGNVTLDAGTGNPVGLGNVAAGKSGTDAVNVDQLTSALDGLGGGAKVNADGTVTNPTYNIGGATYNNVSDALAAQGNLAVQYVADENGKPTNKIVLTGNGSGDPVSITNLKAGEADSDAVNYGQVKDNISYDRNADGTRSNVVTLKGGSNGAVTMRNVADGVADSDAATVRQVKQSASDSRDYTDQQITTLRDNNNEKFAALNGEISDVRKEARAGIASAMAAAGLRYDDRAGKGSIAMGMGGFKNATSIAAGLGYTSEDGNWRLNSAVAHSFSGSATSWNVGASWTFN